MAIDKRLDPNQQYENDNEYSPFATDGSQNPDVWGGAPQSGQVTTNNTGNATQQPQQNQPDMSSWITDGYGNPQYTADQYGDVMLGWDQTNWGDTNMQTPKYVGGRLWSDNNANDAASVQQAAEEFIQAYPGAKYLGRDKIQLPNGEIIDFVVNYGGDGARFNWESDFGSGDFAAGGSGGPSHDPYTNLANQGGGAIDNRPADPSVDPFAAMGGGVYVNGAWVPKDHPLAQQAASTGQSGSTSTTTSNSHSVNVNGIPTDVNSELWSMLMERANQGLDVGRDDANVRQQADAYSAQAERARRVGLTDAAEANSPYNTGFQSGLQRLTAARMGQDVGGFEAQLIGKEIQARRDEIAHALTEMGDLLTDQQKMALEMKLNELDNATQRYGIDKSTDLGYARLGSDDAQWRAQLAQRANEWMGDDAYRYARMGMENNQFLDRLGFDTADRQSYWDWVRSGNKP